MLGGQQSATYCGNIKLYQDDRCTSCSSQPKVITTRALITDDPKNREAVISAAGKLIDSVEVRCDIHAMNCEQVFFSEVELEEYYSAYDWYCLSCKHMFESEKDFITHLQSLHDDVSNLVPSSWELRLMYDHISGLQLGATVAR